MSAVLGLALGCATLPAASLASTPPQIGGLSAEVNENQATLEALIRPDGLETKYELWLQYPGCQSGDPCEPTTSEEIGQGSIPTLRLEEAVSVHLTSLKSDSPYSFVVIASNADGTRRSDPVPFTTSSAPPTAVGGGTFAEFKAEPSALEAGERAEAEAILRAEREAKEKKEEERPAEEAAARAAREREIREAAEREAQLRAAPSCVVPRLKGDSLATARHALAKDHCDLGRVSKPRKHLGALVVVTQSAKAGRKLADGAAIGVRLGPAGKTLSG